MHLIFSKIAKERFTPVDITRLLKIFFASSIIIAAASAQTGTLKVYL
jgi:hypothetical protein